MLQTATAVLVLNCSLALHDQGRKHLGKQQLIAESELHYRNLES